ncbi:MAG TPA: hypothetical protein VFF88_06455 [Methylocella sp.]|nr:hypothetical protein [Methylocella sp.]
MAQACREPLRLALVRAAHAKAASRAGAAYDVLAMARGASECA